MSAPFIKQGFKLQEQPNLFYTTALVLAMMGLT